MIVPTSISSMVSSWSYRIAPASQNAPHAPPPPGKGDIDARPGGEPLVEFRGDRPRGAGRDLGEIDAVGRADDLASAARHADRGVLVVGSADLLLRSPIGEVDGAHSHPLLANPC